MKKPVRSFYYWWQIFNRAEIKNLDKVINKNFITTTDAPAAGVTKTSTVKFVKWGSIKTLMRPVMEVVHYANMMNFGFHLYPPRDDKTLNYNIYEKGGEYDFHEDGITYTNPVSDFKFTCILNLTLDSIEGGDFYLAHRKIEEISQPGCILIFPSFRCHASKPVTKGTRKTLSLWMDGPKFV
jgi:predicted 2-oxoglutarate/Fe(II)-dependent dioxygenase YbiX